ncbi:MAG: M15 family metallopeptidase [Synechococcales bacterium]|nr:M15 family metallopeptidase [Synechococcales bacterium]
MLKPHYQVPIYECREPLEPIPLEVFAVETPHPYLKLGAPYGDRSPYFLRQGVVAALLTAQQDLQHRQPGWGIQIFDAYRPIAVQQFMVDYTFQQQLQTRGWALPDLSEAQQQALWEEVYQFWAVPSADPATPPPHSTGAAVDVTLVDGTGAIANMGSPIDEVSPRSYPNFYASPQDGLEGIGEGDRQRFHQNRELLHSVMAQAGFHRHPQEWWHFCLGDQMWAWLENQTHPGRGAVARYGSI